MTLKNFIDTSYYKKGNKPTASTVEELRALLEDLPDKLPLDAEQVSLTVYNIGSDTEFLSFGELEE